MTTAGAEPVELQQLSGDSGLVAASVRPGAHVGGQVRFELTVCNSGSRAVAVTNPYEGVTYHLINAAGTPVEVNAPPSQAKVHVARDPADKLAYLGLVAATVEGKSVTNNDAIGAGAFDLSGGGEIVLALAVTAALDPSDRVALDHLPAGDYQLVVMLRVVVTAGGRRHPVLLRTARDVPVAAL